MTQTMTGLGQADSVMISDRLGRTYEITLEGVRRLASHVPTSGAGRVWVEVDDRSLPAIDLVVRLTDAKDHMFRLRDLEVALARLGFRVERRKALPADGTGSQLVGRNIASLPDAEDDEVVPPLFSTATAKAMEQFAGHWVGVRADCIVTHGDSPAQILEQAHASAQNPVKVLFVPLPSDVAVE
jgi:hypothetical protein